jgi:hypothetical protein
MTDFELLIEDMTTGQFVEIQYDPASRTEFRSLFTPEGRLEKRHVSKVRINPIPLLKQRLLNGAVRLNLDL